MAWASKIAIKSNSEIERGKKDDVGGGGGGGDGEMLTRSIKHELTNRWRVAKWKTVSAHLYKKTEDDECK